MPTGMLIQKIHSQAKYVTMKPPSGGPRSGPMRAGTVNQAIAVRNSDFFVVRSSIRRPTGVIIAPPAPCTTRASTNISSDVDSEQSTEPSMKTPIARRNTSREPKRSAAQPETGMNVARERR